MTKQPIEGFTLKNSVGASLDVINLGAAITALRLPDKQGKLQDVVLGYDHPADYLQNPYYFGVVVGRFANRIANGSFNLNKADHQLAQNLGPHHIHGGPDGFHRCLWTVNPLDDTLAASNVRLEYLSKDGEENYPGNVSVTVNYQLTQANELVVDYTASTDKPTVINLTQHSYFNLAGHQSGDILDHRIRIHANRYTATGQDQIPTGEIADIQGTPLDLQDFRRIGDVIGRPHPQLEYCSGLDHNYVLKDHFDTEIRSAAEVRDPTTGRTMQVLTDQPGMQLYTGNFIGDGTEGKNGAIYNRHQGLCLETQHFPDSPNHSHFPTTGLAPGETFKSRTIYRFGLD